MSKQEPSLAEEREHFGRRVGLHGVEHARVGQRLGEGAVVVLDDVEVDDQAGAVLPTLTEEFADALGHWRILQLKGTDLAAACRGLGVGGRCAMGTHAARKLLHR